MSRSLFAVLARRYGPTVTAEDRRQFLKVSLAAGAGLMLSGTGLWANALRPSFAAKRIVVVGAGFSGLACAYELKAAGYDVTVVEAADRVGGRVLSFADFIPGRNVEGGGELIGSNHPMWVAYAEQFGLEFLDVTELEDGDFPIVVAGKRLTGEESLALYEELDAILNGMNEEAETINADEPWASPDAAALDKRSIAHWIAAQDCSDLCRAALIAMLGGDNAQAVDRQSYLGMLAAIKGGGGEPYWTESEVYRCKGGNQQLAHKLAGELGKRVIIGLPVRKIESLADKAVVTCADGRTIECDDVVLTTPPTAWSSIELQPSMPGALRPQMGSAVKYLAHVKRRFWLDANTDPASLSDGDISWTWDATDEQPGDENACLTSFSGGPSAERARARKGDARDAAYRAAIEPVYPGFTENFVRARFMDWPGDRLTLAGYSFPAPGQVTTVGPLMQRPIGRVHLAGEHTCYKFVGYMEGGLTSGVQTARRLAARDGVLQPAH